MDTFDYAAVDAAGRRQKGSVAAASAREARDLLRARSLTPVNLRAAKSAKTKAQETEGQAFAFRRSAPLAHKTRAMCQLAILIEATTPVEEALKLTALQFERSPLRGTLLDVRSRVLEGARLSEAMRAHPGTFADLTTAMIASGETSGRLAEVLERLATDMEAAQAMRRQVLGATVYPVLLAVISVVVVAVLMAFVVPKVVSQFDSFGADLPWLTKFVIGMSNWVQAYGLITLIGIGVAIFAFVQALKRPAFRLWWHGVFLRLPVLGKLSRDLNAARFSRTVAGLLSAGMPSLTALDTARHTLRNAVMGDGLEDAVRRVREGASMSSALGRTGVFPPLVVQMVAGGEASGEIGPMFAKSADYLEGEVSSRTSVALALLEPLIIVALGGVILMVVAAIFLPILQLNQLVQ